MGLMSVFLNRVLHAESSFGCGFAAWEVRKLGSSHEPQKLDELQCRFRIGKHCLAAREPVVDVVDPAFNEHSRVSRHHRPPTQPHHNCVTPYLALMQVDSNNSATRCLARLQPEVASSSSEFIDNIRASSDESDVLTITSLDHEAQQLHLRVPAVGSRRVLRVGVCTAGKTGPVLEALVGVNRRVDRPLVDLRLARNEQR